MMSPKQSTDHHMEPIMKPIYIFLLLAVTVVLGLILYLVLREPAVQDGVKELKQDTRELGHDAVRGVKDAADATKDAAKDAKDGINDAVK